MLFTGPALLNRGVQQALRKLGCTVVVAACVATGAVVQAKPPSAAEAIPSIELSALPPEAQQTERLVRSGGPFPYGKDGSVFGNRERLLPARPRGHYREYTVRTPGERTRGARRIVCAGERPAAPDVCYYTADHYASWRRIVQ